MIEIGAGRLEIPLLQGGMGIGVSRSGLAGAVAAEGGMGVISAAQVGYDREEFARSPKACNLAELAVQIQKAREIAGGHGMIGVNIMAVTNGYEEYVQAACQAGADAIITGAGLPTNLPGLVAGYEVAIAPIVSTAKALQVILRYWDKKYSRTADFLVIEGPKAGGHLGFDLETLKALPEYDYDAEVRAIIEAKKVFERQYGKHIPVFLGGGIWNAEGVAHALEMGADGVQIATRFVATEECDAAPAYKQAYVQAREEDVVIIKSPVGMPGRAVKNDFICRMEAGKEDIRFCYACIKGCNPRKAPYCISQALINAVKGDVDNGLIFCGAEIGRIKAITTVAEVIKELSAGWQQEG